MALRNAFGKLSLEDTQLDTREILIAILEQMIIMNKHLQSITDEDIDEFDIQDEMEQLSVGEV